MRSVRQGEQGPERAVERLERVEVHADVGSGRLVPRRSRLPRRGIRRAVDVDVDRIPRQRRRQRRQGRDVPARALPPGQCEQIGRFVLH